MRVGPKKGVLRGEPDSRCPGVVRRSVACRRRVRTPRGCEAGHSWTQVVHGLARTGGGPKKRSGPIGDDPKTGGIELIRGEAENGER